MPRRRLDMRPDYILSGDMKRVAILTHPGLPFDDRYYLKAVAELWREDGLEVVVARGPAELVDADVAIPHLSLTTLPADYLDALRRYPRALNARVVDISKRRYSRLAVDRGFDGPVIVKANRNARGTPEARLDPSQPVYSHEVFESAAELSEEIWASPHLIVERFEPELEGGLFWLRTWEFLGDREQGFRYSSEHPVARASSLTFREPLSSVPDELRALRAELGFDYGSFDYGLAEGRVFVYDVNWTPGFADSLPPESGRALIRTLADGLRAFA